MVIVRHKDFSVIEKIAKYSTVPVINAMSDINHPCEIFAAMKERAVVCTDSLPENVKDKFAECRVNLDVMKLANEGAILNPCPPFYLGEEVSADVIASEFFCWIWI